MDVLEHHIYPALSPSSAVAFSLACTTGHKLFVRSRTRFSSQAILRDIFEFDRLDYWGFFQEILKFPSKLSDIREYLLSRILSDAAFGTDLFKID